MNRLSEGRRPRAVRFLGFVMLVLFASCASYSVPPPAADSEHYVVLLHGLARSERSMRKMQWSLAQQGFATCNITYPSTKFPVEALLRDYVLPAIRACLPERPVGVSFVTHSMGGILVRLLEKTEAMPNIERVVMLSPPNQGSEVVDRVGGFWLFQFLYGPAGNELGTGPDSLPQRLGPARFVVGIITGNRSVNPILSSIVPGEDDGNVSVENAKLEGMQDFLVVPANHHFIMQNDEVIRQTLAFLKNGRFDHPGAGRAPQ